MLEERIRGFLNRKVDRRAFGKAALGGAGLVAAACVPNSPFAPEATPTAISSPTPVPRKEYRYTLSPEERTKLVGYVRDLEIILEDAVNPKFWGKEPLEEITKATDNELGKFFEANAKKQGEQISWHLQLASEEGGPTIDTNVTVKYAKVGGKDLFNEIDIQASLADSRAPELAQFIDPETKQFLPDTKKLRDAALTFFHIPFDLNWYALHKEPREDSPLVGLIGRFGGSKLTDPSVVLLTIHTRGEVELQVATSPMAAVPVTP